MKTLLQADPRLDLDEFTRFFFGQDEGYAEKSARPEAKAVLRAERASSQQSKDCIFDENGNVAI